MLNAVIGCPICLLLDKSSKIPKQLGEEDMRRCDAKEYAYLDLTSRTAWTIWLLSPYKANRMAFISCRARLRTKRLLTGNGK